MKKLITLGLVLMLYPALTYAGSVNDRFGSVAGVVIGSISDESNATLPINQGCLFVKGTLETIGNMQTGGNLKSSGTFSVANGFMDYTQVILKPAAASATAYGNQSISTTTLVSATTTLLVGDFTDIIHPRNVTAVVNFAAGVATTTVAGSVLITGTNARGVAATETLTVSTNSATGSVVWRSLTSAAWTITSVTGRLGTDNALLQLGSGVKMGLDNKIGTSANIYKVIENGSLTTTYTLDTTNDSVTFVNAPDGSKNYEIKQVITVK